jgi:hypothetical protein
VLVLHRAGLFRDDDPEGGVMDLWLPPKPAIILPADKKLLKQSSFLVAPPFFKKAVAAAASVTFTDSAVAITDLAPPNNYTFATRSIGTAAVGRFIVVAAYVFSSSGNKTIDSITIGGNTAALLVSSSAVPAPARIAGLQVDAGTTATIVVNFSGSSNAVRAGIGVWAVYGLASQTPLDTYLSVATGTTENFTLDVQAGGVAICYRGMSAVAARTATWTSITENFDATIESSSSHTGASINTAATVAGQVYPCTASAAVTANTVAMGISFR